MQYTSTRNSACRVSGAQAIVTGLAPGGGLFVPAKVPAIDLAALRGESYTGVALAVLRAFLPEYSPDFLREALEASYTGNFGGKAGHLVRLREGLYALELWHGPTAAFKDYALQLMPRLLVNAKQQLHETGKTLILVATSGDTGKAALEGYKNLKGIGIAVFYPNAGTSEIQRLQMVTQEGGNVAVYAVQGNFDDAQRGVKQAFGDEALAAQLVQRGVKLSSANSINWGRLLPQIVYYATSYLALCEEGALAMGDPLDFCVPTGNFGDIMAGYYAKQMGVPVGTLVCASNQNNVLADFFATGVYNANRNFHKTSSPSMDILVSSNLERLLFHASRGEADVQAWMRALAATGEYRVDDAAMAHIRSTFSAGWANEDEVELEIKRVYEEHGYLCDPHTAVAFCVLRKTVQKQGRPAVVLSTASPFKFSGKVLASLGAPVPQDEFEALATLEARTGHKAPASLVGLRGRPVRFTQVIPAQDIPAMPLKMGVV